MTGSDGNNRKQPLSINPTVAARARRRSAQLETDDERFATNMKTHRERLNWSQGELARQLQEAGWDQFHQTTISRIEKGERPVRIGESRAIATVLGTLVSVLIAPSEAGQVVDRFAVALSQAEDARRSVRDAATDYARCQFVLQMDLGAVLETGYEWADRAMKAQIESRMERSNQLLQMTAHEIAERATSKEDGRFG